MDKINPSLYITDTDPTNEEVLEASNWYEWQYLNNIYDSDRIPWLLAQGWIIYSQSSKYNEDTGHYEAYRWSLKRRVLKSEEALHDLITSFTNAYNTGRQLNDQRYDEIVALFTVMLDKTEDEIISLDGEDTAYDDLIETILATMQTDYDNAKDDLEGLDWGDAREQEIETAFDNKLAEARAGLIAKGMYNTTIWDTVSAGIERERQFALTDLEDEISKFRLTLNDRIYALKVDLSGKILAARDRLRSQLQSQGTERIGLRNQVMQALLGFMERREDGYPDISSVGQITAQLGASQPTYPAP